MSERTIRPLESLADYRACVALQEATWGEGFSERVSMAILKVSQILGGVAAGAFAEDGTLDGFVFGMTGVRHGRVVHWSDMLAVRSGLRDAGLGTRMKAYQRDVLLERDVREMHWTFDPLQARNAHLNFVKLGIVVREYRADMYGASDSPLHAGIGTDRFLALWLMDTPRVAGRLAGSDPPPPAERIAVAPLALDATAEGSHPVPGTPDTDLDVELIRVAIPSDIGSLMRDDLDLAVAWRSATRAVFAHYLAAGWEVREFVRGDGVSHYLLARMASTARDRGHPPSP